MHACRVAGVAFQLVVAPGPRRLSRESLAALRGWLDEQAAALRTPTATPDTPGPIRRLDRTKAERRAQKAADSALVDLEDLVTGDLGATTVSSDVELGG